MEEFVMRTEQEKYHGWSVQSVVERDKTLNPHNYCPQARITIEVNVCSHGQHDGHLWDKAFRDSQEKELAGVIAESIRMHLGKAIRMVDPYAIHC